MDHLFWDNLASDYGIKAEVTKRDNKLKEIVESPSWVIEGVYFKWVAPSFDLADKIFILNTPISIQEERIWNRYEKRKAGILPTTKNETVESIQALIVWNRNYNTDLLPNFVRDSVYKDKMIQLADNESIFNYLTKYGLPRK
ncbi:hypothetical protein [Oceanobacillus polygoni]|uniref:Adenylate kinase family enzyme n=1 Tax=Oceanobacillus polygoni TaxID=1235259 RepID=A0A9X0YQR1_9BACI|nr:hypothetical protein [Oceanobacillus polygoni]MBP2076341.1 adenylate kinase family enzyme [Oceanobacillus polygoni]